MSHGSIIRHSEETFSHIFKEKGTIVTNDAKYDEMMMA